MDRHEYEINQLINPKKDIVKSNSKHRDKIETLIQGRRIGGMIRGGDTPKQETLWAIEFESGKFAFGHANENQIFVATSGIGRQIWYADGNGVIAGSTESVDEVTDTIIDTYNQYFGTKISNLTPDAELFKVGDTVHNWNAYEKIEMPLPYYAVTTGGTNRFAAGYLVNKVWHVYFNNNNMGWGIDNSGLIVAEMGGMDGLITGLMLPKMRQNGIEVESYVQEVIDWNVGETVPNVEQYTFIT